MTPKELLSILSVAEKLKSATRHCFTAPDRKESVADHSWRIALTAMLLEGVPEFADYDMSRVVRMCLIHDLGEAFTGDIPTFLKTEAEGRHEDDLLGAWVAAFPEPQRENWQALLREMALQETNEAKLYKALDKLEALISHNESPLSTWLPLEYDLQFTHGREQVQFSLYLRALREAIDAQSREKIEGGK